MFSYLISKEQNKIAILQLIYLRNKFNQNVQLSN
jgi:hypothetical protein